MTTHRRAWWCIAPVTVLCPSMLALLAMTPIAGESFGRGMNLVVLWFGGTALLGLHALLSLTCFAWTVWQVGNLRTVMKCHPWWVPSLGLVFATPILGIALLRWKAG